MGKVIGFFYDSAMKVITEQGDKKIGWNVIALEMKDTITDITSMKFQMPRQSPEFFKGFFNDMCDQVSAASASSRRRTRVPPGRGVRFQGFLPCTRGDDRTSKLA